MGKKKLIGLCIVHKNHNYGSILQSYATLMKLEELGIDYEIINYSHPQNAQFYLKALSRLGSKDTVYSKIRSFKRKIGKKTHPEYKKNDSIRGRKFQDFISKNFVHFSKPIHEYEELQDYSRKYTDVLVGSDQLWLPSGLGTNFYNLMFVPDEINKIAYSASFGVSSIPEYQKEKTHEYLQRIQHLSLREEAGQKIVKELTGRDVPVILDPTMIVSRELWDRKIEDKSTVEGDYIFCYFLGNNPEQREEVKKLAKKKNMRIVVLRHLDEYIPYDENFGDIAPYDVGPAEFVNLIRHAKYICTDSFHGSVFSIIYHKQFISFNRYTDGSNSRNSRLDTLFRNIGISRRFEGDLLSEIDQLVDWDSVDKKLASLREESSQFIEDALGLDRDVDKKVEIDNDKRHVICPATDCTGCAACSAVCPKNAITMNLDKNGFWRPSIDVALCIDCNSCNRICPVNKAPQTHGPTKAFAYQNSDEVRFNSTSGGFFNAIANKVIDEGGVVCGAAFDDSMVLRHTFVERKENLDPLQRSKYVQSSMDGVYKRIKEYLNEGRKVLFVGVGCQAAALRKYIGESENLIIIDVVCYGVPSSGLFQDWIRYLEKKYGRVVDVRFRDKSYGYASPNVKVLFENGRYIESCRDSNMYTDLFFRHLSIRESCYHCHFKTVDRASDITLGDLWTVGKYDSSRDDNRGTTVAFAHTEKGKEICVQLGCVELDTDGIVATDAKKMVECVEPARGTNSFWKKYKEDGFESTVHLYIRNSGKLRLKYITKKFMNKIGISKYWYQRKKRMK